MQIKRAVDGKYAEVRLGDGSKIFFSVLPDRITASKMFWFIPTEKIWDYLFPFYIRTANEAWQASKDVLKITLDSISATDTITALIPELERTTSKMLRDYVSLNREEAQDLSMDKVGMAAAKQILMPKDLGYTERVVQEFGQALEKHTQEMATKYPMAFPKSLLPAPKEEIEGCLNEALKYADEENRKIIQTGKVYLALYIDDEEANEQNARVLKALRRT